MGPIFTCFVDLKHQGFSVFFPFFVFQKTVENTNAQKDIGWCPVQQQITLDCDVEAGSLSP